MTTTESVMDVAERGQVPVGAKTHSSYEPLKEIMALYPRQSGPIFHSYTDLTHAARWEEMTAVDLGKEKQTRLQRVSGSGWAGLIGRRPGGKKLEAVIPCHIADTLSTSFFDGIYSALATLSSSEERFEELETEHILLAVLSPDSTVVYYKLAKGLVKPVN
ncbi:hypothetical protein BCV69DRAFT_312922 [Microstroma glucosiphilum]|uniref:tRNA-splicing endonuclease subunit Sen15 domain-containing protein n=1 Tax=Pseudomicrostroma glucosiphilum TaxID=1684307 RepID=A0A316U515_9BASI|nr:hypothetical protein BCV69DRAFT_312922 [Pseudomicrostroma glucosiphilum]PWN20326.1 hypothetical protein BCV69DRAFT_312922 [Pseudomicrostroma glucosiphilum]